MNLLFANDRRGRYPDSWYAATATALPPFPPLQGETRADVCIVGGGYTGLSAALHLRQRDYDVVLLEAHRVGFGASGRNGGQLGSGQRLDQAALEKMVGHGDARRLWDIAEEAKATVRALIAAHGIAAELKPGVATAVYSDGELAHAASNIARLKRDYGYTQVEPLDRAGIARLTGSKLFAGGYLDHGAAHLHPLRFAIGLADAAAQAGARLHETSHVDRIEPGTSGTVHTDAGLVRARHIVLATNGYLGKLDRKVAARVMPINNFIVATEPLGERFADILPDDVAVADSKFVVNYWRRSGDGRLLFGGGETYGYRFPRDIASLVRKPMLEIYPQLAALRIDHAWGGTLAISMSRMPYFGRPRPGLWSASGYSGHGVAMATMAGRILAEAIDGDSGRFDVMARVRTPPFPGGSALRAPILALAMTWYSLRDRLGV
jgi:gamma-glutamylputrescine oxidase